MIRFRCRKCGQRLGVPEIHAGKKGRCPKCKNIFVVPKAPAVGPVMDKGQAEKLKPSPKRGAYDLTLQDVPQEYKVAERPAPAAGRDDRTIEDVQRLEEQLGIKKDEPVSERKLPWVIDIFLYPTSKPGLIILGIIIGIPLLFKIVRQVLGVFTPMFLPMLVFLALFAIVGFIVDIILGLYVYWYFCECIRDSAAGGLRAPETVGSTPGLGDMLLQLIRTVGCLAFFTAPVLIYAQYAQKADFIFWSLLTYAVLFFPMGLLAVVMFDSISGINPVLLIRSIFSTFFQYCGLVILFYGLGALSVIIVSILQQWWILAYVSSIALIYLLIVTAHLLGRFYWKYEEKLNWEV